MLEVEEHAQATRSIGVSVEENGSCCRAFEVGMRRFIVVRWLLNYVN